MLFFPCRDKLSAVRTCGVLSVAVLSGVVLSVAVLSVSVGCFVGRFVRSLVFRTVLLVIVLVSVLCICVSCHVFLHSCAIFGTLVYLLAALLSARILFERMQKNIHRLIF